MANGIIRDFHDMHPDDLAKMSFSQLQEDLGREASQLTEEGVRRKAPELGGIGPNIQKIS